LTQSLKTPGFNNPCAYPVELKNCFQTFAFKCNLYRYASGAGLRFMLEESGLVKLGVHRDMAGLYTLHSSQLTHSSKAPGFNPCACKVKIIVSKFASKWVNSYRYDVAAWVLRQMGHPAELAIGQMPSQKNQSQVQSQGHPQGLTLDEWLEFLVRCGFYLAAVGPYTLKSVDPHSMKAPGFNP
jgi:hypothetical protein